MSNAAATVAATTLSAVEWLQLLGLGGLAGALGQGARTIVGLKKLGDAASSANVSTASLIAVSRIVTSLAIGFVAGALAAVGILDSPASVSTEQIFGMVAAGYAGADFIEGIISRVEGTRDAGAGQEAVGVGTAPASTSSSDDAVG
jgi:hypothetical protein